MNREVEIESVEGHHAFKLTFYAESGRRNEGGGFVVHRLGAPDKIIHSDCSRYCIIVTHIDQLTNVELLAVLNALLIEQKSNYKIRSNILKLLNE